MENNAIYQNERNNINIDCLYLIGGYYTYVVSVSTGGYSGQCSFCISEDNVKKYCNKIAEMSKILSGEITIRDDEGDAYLTLQFDSPRNLNILGQIGDSWDDNMLKFKTQADQTILCELSRRLENK